MNTDRKVKSKQKKNLWKGFLVNLIAVTIGVLLAFTLQDSWKKNLDSQKTKKLLSLTYQECAESLVILSQLNDNYLNHFNHLNNLNLTSTEFINELLTQQNLEDFLSDSEMMKIYNYSLYAKHFTSLINDYNSHYICVPDSLNKFNLNYFNSLCFLYENFVSTGTIVCSIINKYDIDRDESYKKDIQKYFEDKDRIINLLKENRLFE